MPSIQFFSIQKSLIDFSGTNIDQRVRRKIIKYSSNKRGPTDKKKMKIQFWR